MTKTKKKLIKGGKVKNKGKKEHKSKISNSCDSLDIVDIHHNNKHDYSANNSLNRNVENVVNDSLEILNICRNNKHDYSANNSSISNEKNMVNEVSTSKIFDESVEILEISSEDEIIDGFEGFPKSKSSNQKVKTKSYKQHYRKAWEEMPEFKGWLSEFPDNPRRAYCNVCEKTFYAHRLTLLKHTTTFYHMKRAKEQNDAKKIDNETLNINLSGKEQIPNGLKDSNETFNEKNEDTNSVNNYLETVLLEEDGCANRNSTVTANSVSFEPMITEGLDSSANTKLNGFLNQSTNDCSHTTKDAEIDNTEASKQKRDGRSLVTTHVLDTTRGFPMPNLPVTLYKLIDGRWTFLKEGRTDLDGRCEGLTSSESIEPGRYKLHYDTDYYFCDRKKDRLFPFIEIVFDLSKPKEHIHIPLLVSPFSYSTYKGS